MDNFRTTAEFKCQLIQAYITKAINTKRKETSTIKQGGGVFWVEYKTRQLKFDIGVLTEEDLDKPIGELKLYVSGTLVKNSWSYRDTRNPFLGLTVDDFFGEDSAFRKVYEAILPLTTAKYRCYHDSISRSISGLYIDLRKDFITINMNPTTKYISCPSHDLLRSSFNQENVSEVVKSLNKIAAFNKTFSEDVKFIVKEMSEKYRQETLDKIVTFKGTL